MRIVSIRTIEGPNTFHHRPVLLMMLDLGGRSDLASDQIPGFVEALLSILPGLTDHGCSKGEPGGFVERLGRGTYLAHIVEHVALELSELAGIGVTFGKTVASTDPGVYLVVTRYQCAEGMKDLLRVAVSLVEGLLEGRPFPLEDRLRHARELVEDARLGLSTRCIVDAARRRGIPWQRIGENNLVQLGYGKHLKLIEATVVHGTRAIGVDIAQDKGLTKEMLRHAGIPCPEGIQVRSEVGLEEALSILEPPLVVKPLDGHQGKGVTLGLSNLLDLQAAFRLALDYSSRVLIEEQFVGRDYRVLVVGQKVVAASERTPAHVVGDGTRTLLALIEKENQNPDRAEGHGGRLTKIVLDDLLIQDLTRRSLTLDHIPDPGVRVLLRQTANLSTGGTARDVTDEIHPDVASMCIRAARIIGLDVCGIDLVCPDIGTPSDSWNSGGIIELNAGPGFRMHQFPSDGKSRDVGTAVVEMLFPEDSNGRIPIISVTGTNGKTTTVRLIAHALERTGAVTGVTTSEGILIGGQVVDRGDTTGPASARALLCDPAVEVAVLETARGGIARRGLGYDWSDIGVLTNIQPDHIGQDGIEDLEDILRIKSLVAERVREGGTLVLNADDPHLAHLAESSSIRRVPRHIVYTSLSPDHLTIRRHLAAGRCAYYLDGDWLIEARGNQVEQLIQAIAIPAAIGGIARFQIANALAAAAACRAHGLTIDQVAWGLASFGGKSQNFGRLNLFRVGKGYLILDYGHNPEALRAVGHMLRAFAGRRLTGVVGLPGDRADSLLEDSSRVAARIFHRIVVREDEDRRGRGSGDLAGLICRTIQEESPRCVCEVVLDEREAILTAVRTMQPGEIVVAFWDSSEAVEGALDELGAYEVSAIPDLAKSRLMVGA